MTTVYLAGAISGRSFAEAKKSFDERAKLLHDIGFDTISPLDGIEHLDGEQELKPSGYDGTASDEAIFSKFAFNLWCSEIIWADFIGAKRVSIGSCFEIGAAWGKKRPILVTMESDNIHRHAFINQSAIIFEDWDSVIEYLRTKGTNHDRHD